MGDLFSFNVNEFIVRIENDENALKNCGIDLSEKFKSLALDTFGSICLGKNLNTIKGDNPYSKDFQNIFEGTTSLKFLIYSYFGIKLNISKLEESSATIKEFCKKSIDERLNLKIYDKMNEPKDILDYLLSKDENNNLELPEKDIIAK